jgi:phosphotransferase system  glucose/maltose/N-acetylglucosamine-specific IIC component
MPGSGRTTRIVMIIVAVIVIAGLLASVAAAPATVGP